VELVKWARFLRSNTSTAGAWSARLHSITGATVLRRTTVEGARCGVLVRTSATRGRWTPRVQRRG
jgi:hypothetical protein